MNSKKKPKSSQKKANEEVEKPLFTKIQYNTFLLFICVLFGLNLFVLNDVQSVHWEPEQVTTTAVAWQDGAALQETNHAFPSNWYLNFAMNIYVHITHFIGENIFAMRFAGILFLLACMFGTYHLGKRFLGVQRMRTSLLILMASFLWVNLAKFALLDVWIGGIQMVLFCSMVLYVKQPIVKWRNLTIFLLFLAIYIAPIQNFVFGFGFWLYLYLLHPKGQNLVASKTYLVWIPLAILVFLLPNPLTTLAWSTPLRFLAMSGLGMLLFIAFLIPGLWQLLIRVTKKEEFSILLFGGLLMSVLTLSTSMQFFFAVLIARQLRDYFEKNYPYESFIKTIGILSVLAAFMISMYYMMTGFQSMGPIGFRAAMLLSMAYWVPNLLFLIGLYAKRRRMIEGGLLISGTMLTLIFWMHTAPMLFTEWF